MKLFSAVLLGLMVCASNGLAQEYSVGDSFLYTGTRGGVAFQTSTSIVGYNEVSEIYTTKVTLSRYGRSDANHFYETKLATCADLRRDIEKCETVEWIYVPAGLLKACKVETRVEFAPAIVWFGNVPTGLIKVIRYPDNPSSRIVQELSSFVSDFDCPNLFEEE